MRDDESKSRRLEDMFERAQVSWPWVPEVMETFSTRWVEET